MGLFRYHLPYPSSAKRRLVPHRNHRTGRRGSAGPTLYLGFKSRLAHQKRKTSDRMSFFFPVRKSCKETAFVIFRVFSNVALQKRVNYATFDLKFKDIEKICDCRSQHCGITILMTDKAEKCFLQEMIIQLHEKENVYVSSG